MSFPAPRHRYTFQEYLVVEESSAIRHEFLDGDIFAMAGGTPEHAALAAALLAVLVPQLRGKPCRAYSSDLRLRVLETGLATYPDAAVICGPLEHDPASPTHVTNPSAVFEVLSSSTEDYDRGEKREHFQRVPTMHAYVLISQAERRVEAWLRGDGEAWEHRTAGDGDVLELDAIGCRLPIRELYETAGL
jgi:Uma2 family endonuclease